LVWDYLPSKSWVSFQIASIFSAAICPKGPFRLLEPLLDEQLTMFHKKNPPHFCHMRATFTDQLGIFLLQQSGPPGV